jgi:hypothetical protein
MAQSITERVREEEDKIGRYAARNATLRFAFLRAHMIILVLCGINGSKRTSQWRWPSPRFAPTLGGLLGS